MSGTLINDYSNSDSNILAVQSTLDKTFFGKIDSITLTEFDSSTVPAIAAGSVVENNGAIYQFASEEAISTTDPVTSATVADGTVYVCLVPGTGTITAAFTATAPTWSDSKQGWYGTGGQANYRYLSYEMTKATASYSRKKLFPFPSLKSQFIRGDGAPVSTVRVEFNTGVTGTGSEFDLIPDTETIDTESEFNISTGVFTPIYDGYFRITAYFYVLGITGTADGEIKLKIDTGAGYVTQNLYFAGAPVGETINITVSDIIELSSGDNLKFTFDGSATTFLPSGSAQTSYITIQKI